MDDLRVDSLSFGDSLPSRTQDESKRRSKKKQVEPEEDQVTLSSAGETGDQPSGYAPASSGGRAEVNGSRRVTIPLPRGSRRPASPKPPVATDALTPNQAEKRRLPA